MTSDTIIDLDDVGDDVSSVAQAKFDSSSELETTVLSRLKTVSELADKD